MKKLIALITCSLVLSLICFTVWQLSRGNLEAAFMPVPILLALYFLLVSRTQ